MLKEQVHLTAAAQQCAAASEAAPSSQRDAFDPNKMIASLQARLFEAEDMCRRQKAATDAAERKSLQLQVAVAGGRATSTGIQQLCQHLDQLAAALAAEQARKGY